MFAMGVLMHIVLSIKGSVKCKGWHVCLESQSLETKSRAKTLILKEVQYDNFRVEIEALCSKNHLSKGNPLLSLDPFLDDVGLLRVGGRLSQSNLSVEEKHPIILPRNHHVTKLLIRHCHESVYHQGRLFTEGAIRQSGYWILGGKRIISSLIFNCVTCRKFRGKFETQKMSDLPTDRTEQTLSLIHI